MKIILIMLSIVYCGNLYCQTSLDGIYRGTKQISYSELGWARQSAFRISKPSSTFYQLAVLKISGDSVFLDNYSISVVGGDTTFLPSDDIYQYFSGKMTEKDSTIQFSLNEVVINYFEQAMKVFPDGHFEVIRRQNNFEGKIKGLKIYFNNIEFKKTQQKFAMISEHPELSRPIFYSPTIPPSAVVPTDAMLRKL